MQGIYLWSKAANGRDGYWSTNLGQVPAPICLYTLSKSVWGIFYRADSFYRNSLKAELVGGFFLSAGGDFRKR